MPEHVPHQLAALAANLQGVNWFSVGLVALSFAIIYGLPRVAKSVPPSIVAVVVTTLLAWLLEWPVETVGSKFGGITAGFPGWHLPAFSLDAVRDLMGPAFTIAALGGIESLLSAAVADGMTDTRHHSDQELIGQGLANIFTPLLGGIAATGAIARTAASIRSGARTPVAGIVHALVLLLVALVAAPLAKFIPLAALSAILMTVALRMAEWDNFPTLWRGSRTEFAVMLAAFGLTVVFDLTIGVGAGLIMAVALFVRHMEEIAHVELLTPESDPEMEGSFSLRGKTVPPGVVLFRFHGPFFFAAADKLEAALRASGGSPRAVVFRMRDVPSMDVTGLHAFRTAVEKMRRDHVTIYVTGMQPQPMKTLYKSGVVDMIGVENFCANIDEALERCATTEGAH
jgi:SulP family sulfate permease